MSFRKPIIVKRVVSSGGYFNGNYIPGGTPALLPNVTASVQPATGKVLESLPEGRRDSESYVLFTDTELKTVETSETKNPDIVVINNTDFEVVKVKPYQSKVLSHYQVVISKVE